MNEFLCSSGAISRSSDFSAHEAILELGPRVPADGIEVIFYPSWYERVDAVASDLRRSGLRFPVLHAEKNIGASLSSEDAQEVARALAQLEVNCALAEQVGAELVVLHLWAYPDSDAFIERNLAVLPECCTIAGRHGLRLAVETIPCSKADPLTQIRRAIDTDVRCLVTLDTEFLAHHGQLEAAIAADWLWDSGRVCHIHVKDYGGSLWTPQGRRFMNLGDGQIEFPEFFAGLNSRGFTGSISYEGRAVTAENEVDLAVLVASLALLGRLAGCP